MKAGIIGVPEDDAKKISDVEAFEKTREEWDQELTTAITTSEVRTLSGDTKFIEGTAIHESMEDDERAIYEDGSIKVRETKTKQQQYGQFTVVPANDQHNGFVIVSSSSATFAFDLIDRSTIINRANLQLGSFHERFEDSFNATTAGMGGKSGEVDSAVVWGNNVMEDDDLKKPLGTALKANTVSQLAGTFMSDGVRVKANLAESGYVEVYEPDYETSEFLEWVGRDILPFADGTVDPE